MYQGADICDETRGGKDDRGEIREARGQRQEGRSERRKEIGRRKERRENRKVQKCMRCPLGYKVWGHMNRATAILLIRSCFPHYVRSQPASAYAARSKDNES